jgi:hypothetical protein
MCYLLFITFPEMLSNILNLLNELVYFTLISYSVTVRGMNKYKEKTQRMSSSKKLTCKGSL